ncbi:uncharacterized protein PV09_03666 [Verruconis gallopava]|uniref:C2H2-type domain-containing protein n=1 Tax=Verruconis gallopava TaxID=253628 RepID=A0A0D2AF57_9PEZI|nr:uncharacterized protein PV09_03666 [Verruconis gallopava]KIW05110.1 hypothetical protein PV09_03666 [Verruconis gallopava]
MSHSTSAPSIKVFGSGPHHGLGAAARPVQIPPASPNSISARPMAIPNSREAPPPPLPPPRRLAFEQGEDLGWKYGNRFPPSSPHASVKPGSSLLGSGQSSKEYASAWSSPYDTHDTRRGSTVSSVTPIDPSMIMEGLEHSDEDRGSGARPSLSRFQSESNLGRKEVHTASQAYDKHLLSRIGGPNAGTSSNNKFAAQLKPLSVPEHRYSSIDSPLSRWASAPSSGISPSGGFRSPYFEHTSIDSAFPSRVNSVSTPDAFDDAASSSYRSHRNSDDQGVFLDPELTKMDGLDIHDRTASTAEGEQLGATGVKRRASSPPSDGGPSREDRVSGTGNDLYHRRSMQMLATKNSPVISRPAQYGTSHSSTLSLGQKASSSFASTWNMSTSSSLTSYSGERLSPGALSPSADPDFGAVSPYAASRSLNLSPRSSLSTAPPHQTRKPSEPIPDQKMQSPTPSDVHSRQNSVSKPPKPKAWEGYPHVCECCPKKPKKFDTAEELRMHELEKRYQCVYCPNRFKNKNEAERHQNSLHLRKHAWSCAALSGVPAAFHASHIHPTTYDVCGYCGEEFPNPPNWDVRAEHLCQQHKFGECNQAKKFFRADHFRQHLKHSHAGTSGKWTNMLENACMLENEPATAPLPPRNVLAPAGPMMMSPPSYPTPSGYETGVINEAHDEQ